MAQIHQSSVWCNVLARPVACVPLSVDATQGKGRKICCSENVLCDREDVIDDDVGFDDADP